MDLKINIIAINFKTEYNSRITFKCNEGPGAIRIKILAEGINDSRYGSKRVESTCKERGPTPSQIQTTIDNQG